MQNVFPLSYNTQVKITVAKYYIPSGRCIQEIDYAHKNASGNPDHIPDSLVTAYKTMHGRTVYDGKGISPDIATDTSKLSTVAYNLITKYIIFDYATKYNASHSSIEPAKSYQFSEADFNDFIAFTQSKGFEFKTVAEKELETVKKAAEYENCFDDIKTLYTSMLNAIDEHKKKDLIENKKEISDILKQEIASRYYYQKGRIESSLNDDPDLENGIKVLKDITLFSSILDGTYIKADKTTKPVKNQN